MKGTLSKEAGIKLPDLLQIVCVSGVPGSVVIQDKLGAQSGVINISQGRVLNASFGSARNQDAIRAMLVANQLDFNYVPEIRDSTESINQDLTGLLLDCAVHMDENVGQNPENKSEFTFTLTQDTAENVPADMKDLIRGDCEYLQYHAARIGSSLGYDRIVAVSMNENKKILAFKCYENSLAGIFSSKVINSTKALEILG